MSATTAGSTLVMTEFNTSTLLAFSALGYSAGPMALALPRIRDFRGVPGKSFDGRGNYSLGMREQLAFPEIDYDKVDRLRGLEISIVTTAKTDEEGRKLLELLGMPFQSN